jgi:hypothetical protein
MVNFEKIKAWLFSEPETWFRVADYFIYACMGCDLAIQVMLYVVSPHNTYTLARVVADVFWPIAVTMALLGRRVAMNGMHTWRDIAKMREQQVQLLEHVNQVNHERFMRWAHSLETGLPPEDEYTSVH